MIHAAVAAAFEFLKIVSHASIYKTPQNVLSCHKFSSDWSKKFFHASLWVCCVWNKLNSDLYKFTASSYEAINNLANVD